MQDSILQLKKNKKINIFGTNYKLISKKGIDRNSIQIVDDNVVMNLKDNCTEKQYANLVKNWYRNILRDARYGSSKLLTQYSFINFNNCIIYVNKNYLFKTIAFSYKLTNCICCYFACFF